MPIHDLSAQEFLLSDPLCLGYVNAVTDLQRQGELGNNITVRTTADILREPGMSIEVAEATAHSVMKTLANVGILTVNSEKKIYRGDPLTTYKFAGHMAVQ
jgi:hypothetical protein